MTDWNSIQYLKFEDERTRPAADLLAHVPLRAPRHCIDIGCGPGNSTELLARRFPDAAVEGMDSSPDMLAKARQRLPGVSFELGDIATWRPVHAYDLIFANAVLQWLPGHARLLPALAGTLAPGGCLAVQMPDNLAEPSHTAMAEVARTGAWADRLQAATDAGAAIGSFDDYYRWMREAGCDVDLWRTTYVHKLAGTGAIVEWFKSTGLKPYIDPLPEAERAEFLARYEQAISRSYKTHQDGTVLLAFPRIFIVARRMA